MNVFASSDFCLPKLWAQVDSNHRPLGYQPSALTSWAISPFFCQVKDHRSLWRWGESNPWPPACRAGALPAELHPRLSGFGFEGFFLQWTFSYSFDPSKLNNRNTLISLPLFWVHLSDDTSETHPFGRFLVLHRKEVIQPHLPIRLPCYDLTPIIEPTFGCSLLAVRTQTSGLPDFHGLTGGVYKARERIHRGMLIRDY